MTHILRFLMDPNRDAPAIPFRTNIGARSCHYIQFFLTRHLKKSGNIVFSTKFPNSRPKLVIVPWKIDIYRVIPRRFQLPHSWPPVFPGNSKIEKRRAKQYLRFSVNFYTTIAQKDLPCHFVFPSLLYARTASTDI